MKTVTMIISLMLMTLIPQTIIAVNADSILEDAQSMQSPPANVVLSGESSLSELKTWFVVKVTDDIVYIERTNSTGEVEATFFARLLKPFVRVGDTVQYDKKRKRVRNYKDYYKTWEVVNIIDDKIFLGRIKSIGETEVVNIERSRRPYLEVGDRVRYDKVRNRLRKTLPKETNLNNEQDTCFMQEQIASSYSAQQKYEEAIKYYYIVIKNCPDNYHALFQIGTCYYRTGERNKALEYMNIAISKANELGDKEFAGLYTEEMNVLLK